MIIFFQAGFFLFPSLRSIQHRFNLDVAVDGPNLKLGTGLILYTGSFIVLLDKIC